MSGTVRVPGRSHAALGITWLLSPGRMIALFLLVYVALALLFQAVGRIPADRDGAPIEMFTGGLLWMLSAISLLGACLNVREMWRSLFWLGASAALGAVAIDELFAFHEKTRFALGDDDISKILMFIGAAGIIAVLARVRSTDRPAASLLWLGLALHTCYLLVDMGDGDYFTIPKFSLDRLRLLEELLELSALCAYFAAFAHLVMADVRRLIDRAVRTHAAGIG